ncbi:MAG: hypothetical protein N3D82_04325 [Ignisphaera sp.]|nr:hypothetical protein [Ignisphaera sp.]
MELLAHVYPVVETIIEVRLFGINYSFSKASKTYHYQYQQQLALHLAVF